MRVVHVKKEAYTDYIGRWHPDGFEQSPLANPHRVGEPCKVCSKPGKPVTHERGTTLTLYEAWLRNQWKQGADNPARQELMRLAQRVADGEDVVLGCWCHPRACHGEILTNVIQTLIAKGVVTPTVNKKGQAS